MYDSLDASSQPLSFRRFLPVCAISRCTLCSLLFVALAGMHFASPITAVAQEDSAAETPVQDEPKQEKQEQENPAEDEEKAADDVKPQEYAPAIKLLPDSVAGLIRIPNMPKFHDAFEKTHLGQLQNDELLKPFFDAQRERVREYLKTKKKTLAIQPEDIVDMASGEVALAWLPFPNDQRPYSVCVIADVRGRIQQADDALAKVDQDLTAGNWTRTDVTYQGQTVRVYDSERKPGQIKVEQIAICRTDSRVISADRDTVITDLLDAIAGNPKGSSLSENADFKKVISKSGKAIAATAKDQGGTLAVEWFARPFAMGRILREAFEIDRGNDIDIIKLLENQGFDAITTAGGVMAINGDKYDMYQKGLILANRPFEKAARMLAFDSRPTQPIPAWVPAETASFNRLFPKIEEAFWASGSLVDEALGDEIFESMIDGIHKDKDGPQIDVRNDVLPSLDNEVILLTDNILPADVSSERLLVAIRIKDAEKIKDAVRRAMEVDGDASKMEVPDLQDIDVWHVQRGQDEEDDFDADLFDDLDFGEEEEAEEAPPLLDRWAIALVPKGAGSEAPYLMFSSHPEFLIAVAKRAQNGAKGGLADVQEIKQVTDSLKELGCEKPIFDRVARSKLSLRVKYELLRQGKLRDSDSVLAKLILRVAEEDEDVEEDPVDATKLPPIEKIEHHLPDGGAYFQETDDGWEMTSFLLK